MANKCNENISVSAIDISCSTTRCSLAATDTAHHVIDITNNRPGTIYEVEICSISLNAFIDFNGAPKSVIQPGSGMVGSASTAPRTSVNLRPLSGPGSDEIQTTVKFYDATQRLGNHRYVQPPETHQIDYEIDLL
jgi:hypothetical protein